MQALTEWLVATACLPGWHGALGKAQLCACCCLCLGAATLSSRMVQITDFNLDWAVGFHMRFSLTNQKWLWLILVVPLHVLLRLARNFWFKLFLVNKMGMSPDNVSSRREDLHGSWSTMSAFGGLPNPVLSTPLVSEHPELAFFQTNADTCTSRSKSSETARGSTFQLRPLGQATRQSSPVLRCYWLVMFPSPMHKNRWCYLERFFTLFLRPVRKRPKVWSQAQHCDWWPLPWLLCVLD